jgi:Flp pilus assembly protein TadD
LAKAASAAALDKVASAVVDLAASEEAESFKMSKLKGTNLTRFLSGNALASGLLSLTRVVGPAASADPLTKFVPFMSKFYWIAMLLLFAGGCSSLHFAKPRRQVDAQHNASISQPKPPLADPGDQQLAIAWETAKLAEQRGMDQQAIEAYRKVRQYDPSRPGVAHALAVLYDRSGMTDAARREYRQSLEEDPNSADLHCDHGYFLYSIGETAKAESSLNEALELEPGHRQATINLALVAGSQGRYDQAMTLFTEAIGPAAALHNVGMLRLRAGETEAARRMLAEARRKDPSIARATPVLRWLEKTGGTGLRLAAGNEESSHRGHAGDDSANAVR